MDGDGVDDVPGVVENCHLPGIAGFIFSYFLFVFVNLREREGQGVDPGRSLKGHL